MKIICVGGGPAGLYFAISMKRLDAGHDITVVERDPPGATYGWGVVYWEDLLDTLYSNDPESARQVRSASVVWQEQQVSLRDEDFAFIGGYGYSVTRVALLDILTRRATELGVRVRHRHEIDDPAELASADLVVAADGANSRIRKMYADSFGTHISTRGNPYLWLGTRQVFESFVFAFEETPAGWIWCHAYPSSADTSTCVIECTTETWEGLGFGSRDNDDCVRELEKIFARPLGGRSLISMSRGRPAEWLRFDDIRNDRWFHGNVVLLGDAAHTTHFTIGSGTKMAMIDSVVLAENLHRYRTLSEALADYDRRGRAALSRIQAASRASMEWFERAERYLDRNAVDFTYAMSKRVWPSAPWSYPLLHLHQVPTARRILRTTNSARRWLLARRRGEPVVPPQQERSRLP